MQNALWVGGSMKHGMIPMLGTGKRGLRTYIKDIFRNGEQGFAYDPTNLSTMYKNTSGTIPVTGVGQRIARMQDLSGQEIHALQPDMNLRPIRVMGGFKYPDNSPGFIVNVPVELTNCTIVMSSHTDALGITTGQTVSADTLNIAPDGFCMVINRLLTKIEIAALKAATRTATTQIPYWQLNNKSLMWNPVDTNLMWA